LRGLRFTTPVAALTVGWERRQGRPGFRLGKLFAHDAWRLAHEPLQDAADFALADRSHHGVTLRWWMGTPIRRLRQPREFPDTATAVGTADRLSDHRAEPRR